MLQFLHVVTMVTICTVLLKSILLKYCSTVLNFNMNIFVHSFKANYLLINFSSDIDTKKCYFYIVHKYKAYIHYKQNKDYEPIVLVIQSTVCATLW